MKKQKFLVTGMTCAACSSRVQRAVEQIDGVKEVQINLLTGGMSVEYDEKRTNDQAIEQAVVHAGYGARANQPTAAEQPGERQIAQNEASAGRLWWSVGFLIPLFYLGMAHMIGLPIPQALMPAVHPLIFALAQLLLTIPIVVLNRSYFARGIPALFGGGANMDTLVAMGAGAALLYSVVQLFQLSWLLEAGDFAAAHERAMGLYFESAGMILALVTVGKYWEGRSKRKTTDAISMLLDLSPKTALVERNGQQVTIPTDQVQVGDLVVLRPGASVPVDGEVLQGHSVVDESMLTGESLPVEKEPGSVLHAGTVNATGAMTMKALRVGEDTTLSQIVSLMEQAGASKAPVGQLADRISRVFVPIVLALAAISGIVWLLAGEPLSAALRSAISVAVISCPCALGLATPVAVMVGTGQGAKRGILIKSAAALQALGEVQTVVLDKTGTLTQGKPQVTAVYTAPGMTREELLQGAASLEHASEHPLAVAVLAAAKEGQIHFESAVSFASEPGFGVSGLVNGTRWLGGNRKLMEREGISLGELAEQAEQLSGQGATPLFFAREGQAAGIIAAADGLKTTSKWAVERLEQLGLTVTMVTGDNEQTARSIASQAGISQVLAGVLPGQKSEQVVALQQKAGKVAMIGDGINDAPALAAADVGIAIGAGTDIALESADIVLVHSDLADAAAAIELSRSVMRIIKQNLFWALFYNCLGIPLAAGVFYPALHWQLSPGFAAAAMSLSSIFVVSNALRLYRFHPASPPAVRQEEQEQSCTLGQTCKIKEETEVKKRLLIEGMTCGHCQAHVEQALNAIAGVSAKVDLASNSAEVVMNGLVSDEALRQAVEQAGYTVTEIKELKE